MRLRRGLNTLHLFALASGAMVSSGIFILPGLAFAQAGPSVIVSYLLAGLLATAGTFAIAELATAMPKAGGDYYYVTRGLGPAAGTISGLLSWFSLSLKSSFALVGMSAFGVALLPVDPRLVGLVLCLVFLGINLVGVRSAAWVQVGLVGGLLVLMVAYIIVGTPHMRPLQFTPFAPGGWRATTATAGFVFVAYGGLLNVTSVAEEVRRPVRAIPRGLLTSLVVVLIGYVAVVFVTVGVLPAEQLAASLTPISDGASAVGGRWWYWAMGLAAVLAFVSTANAGMMAASRYLLALSRDRLLPGFLGRVNQRFGTPYTALFATAGLIAASLVVELELLVKAASTVLMGAYMLSMLVVIIMREGQVGNYRPRFKMPFYPWLPIAGLLGFTLLLFGLGSLALTISAALAVSGFAVYWLYGRHRTSREFALLHLIERLTARELVTGSLEAELYEVIRERERLGRDWFDDLIENCIVLDLAGKHDVHSLTERVADALAARVGIEPALIYDRLIERETETSSALSPTLAIPHVIFDGTGRFELAMVRCRPGISFSEAAPAVDAVFVIIGTRDRRNLHLRTLAAIAQIARSPSFEQRWRSARGETGLRNIIMLGKRRRH